VVWVPGEQIEAVSDRFCQYFKSAKYISILEEILNKHRMKMEQQHQKGDCNEENQAEEMFYIDWSAETSPFDLKSAIPFRQTARVML